jgi:geranylgeranyl diphosphate/geranylgeranyl-bacteriochlorophyllide a reductase
MPPASEEAETMQTPEVFDCVVVGGGPAGATAAADLARKKRNVLLLERGGRIKPCGGAIPPRLIDEFAIPAQLLVARVTQARMVSPSRRHVDIPIDGGFVGMVDREVFDEWLRARAVSAGATRRTGTFTRIDRDPDGTAVVHYDVKHEDGQTERHAVRARTVIGADGANSQVARHGGIPGAETMRKVFAYHEIVRSPKEKTEVFDPTRCDVIYDGQYSPDFYSWVFPHGTTTSIGMGTAVKGFSLRKATGELRQKLGLEHAETIRTEGAPLPLQPHKRWDNGKDVLLAGDAAGCVAPSSGEGIFYAMTGGRLAADAIDELCRTGNPKALKSARRRFMRTHGPVFWILGVMQDYWYINDNRRERFVTICKDKDVQQLTFDAYMDKELVKAKPLAHMRIFFKNLAHLSGLAKA